MGIFSGKNKQYDFLKNAYVKKESCYKATAPLGYKELEAFYKNFSQAKISSSFKKLYPNSYKDFVDIKNKLYNGAKILRNLKISGFAESEYNKFMLWHKRYQELSKHYTEKYDKWVNSDYTKELKNYFPACEQYDMANVAEYYIIGNKFKRRLLKKSFAEFLKSLGSLRDILMMQSKQLRKELNKSDKSNDVEKFDDNSENNDKKLFIAKTALVFGNEKTELRDVSGKKVDITRSLFQTNKFKDYIPIFTLFLTYELRKLLKSNADISDAISKNNVKEITGVINNLPNNLYGEFKIKFNECIECIDLYSVKWLNFRKFEPQKIIRFMKAMKPSVIRGTSDELEFVENIFTNVGKLKSSNNKTFKEFVDEYYSAYGYDFDVVLMGALHNPKDIVYKKNTTIGKCLIIAADLGEIIRLKKDMRDAAKKVLELKQKLEIYNDLFKDLYNKLVDFRNDRDTYVQDTNYTGYSSNKLDIFEAAGQVAACIYFEAKNVLEKKVFLDMGEKVRTNFNHDEDYFYDMLDNLKLNSRDVYDIVFEYEKEISGGKKLFL